MKPDQTSEAPVERVKLWDPLLRIFHWALAICVISAWLLGEFGPDIMTLHFYFGYAVIGLLAFRILWGLVGPGPARFTHFIYGPKTLFGYLARIGRREPSYWPGHNPLGALAVFALLLILIAQVATGLISDPEDYVNVGPLAGSVSSATNRWALSWHHTLAPIILIVVLIHVGAVIFYRIWKHENLIRPMIDGWKLIRRRD